MTKQHPDDQFLGTRSIDGKDEKGANKYGDYVWKTYKQTNDEAVNLAKGLKASQCVNDTEGEGKTWRFLGLWAKNRAEWTITLLASMMVKGTVVGFYDAMSFEAVDYILKQTKMTTMLVAGEYVAKILKMRSEGLALQIEHLVVIDDLQED